MALNVRCSLFLLPSQSVYGPSVDAGVNRNNIDTTYWRIDFIIDPRIGSTIGRYASVEKYHAITGEEFHRSTVDVNLPTKERTEM